MRRRTSGEEVNAFCGGRLVEASLRWLTITVVTTTYHIGASDSLRRALAGGEGFEPPPAESESAVLPLDDPPIARR